MQERRKHPRGLTYLGGQITFSSRLSTGDCLVRNMSQNGAKIVFSNFLAMPDEFNIQIHKKGESRRVRLIWRTHTELGIAFLPAEPTSASSIKPAGGTKQPETDRSALVKRVEILSSGQYS